MKVAIDYDKTYDANPTLFNHIATRFQTAGHQVGILTARHPDEGCPVSFVPDFIAYLDCGDKSYQERALMKANYMEENQIAVIFDDRANLFPSDKVALHII